MNLNRNHVFTRVDDHHEEGESNDEEPEVDKEVISAPLDDLDDGRDQRKSYDLHQDELLDLKFTKPNTCIQIVHSDKLEHTNQQLYVLIIEFYSQQGPT